MNKPLPTVKTAQPYKGYTPRAEAVHELEEEVINLFAGCERAFLMADDLVQSYFDPLSKNVGKQDREKAIIFYFEESRIRAQILHDILFKVRVTAETLNAELRKSAKEA